MKFSAQAYGWTLDDIAAANIRKLEARDKEQK